VGVVTRNPAALALAPIMFDEVDQAAIELQAAA
jgi:hypothetical protein